jgi:hypothetical protein
VFGFVTLSRRCLQLRDSASLLNLLFSLAVILKPISLPNYRVFSLSYCKIVRDYKIIQVKVKVKVVEERGRARS